MDRILRAVIVDDEELSRTDLKMLLKRFPTIEVIGEAKDVKTASDIISKFKPDIIFLDIEFPGESGFDLLEKIDTRVKIVFVTAFDEYAIRAFEVNAMDYLLKPVNPDRLAVSLKRFGTEEGKNKVIKRLKIDDRIFLELNYKYYFLKVNMILKITSAGSYSDILTTNGHKGLTKKTMSEWEDCLPENYFIRIHRTTIINAELVEKIEKHRHSSYYVYLKNLETPLTISRRRAAKMRKRIAHLQE
jgi:two-component system LytT family response regulator